MLTRLLWSQLGRTGTTEDSSIPLFVGRTDLTGLFVSTSAQIRTGTEFLHQPERSKFILFCKSNKIQQLTQQVVARSVAVAYNNFPKLLCWQELPSVLNSFLLPETAASKLTSVNYVEGNISSITHTHLTTALYSKLFCFTLCFLPKIIADCSLKYSFNNQWR